ncbi:OmpA family protein [Labrys monachus]|uniref:Outer membrane protein OmpA-like peptidoglycan-associated protein n=1 Tax=Labrys monachus TaxID=217067 RepID=A0ABU0F7P0_9HYPH|nr:OmpA family protein [Labrys monachus]MDQ0390626.1 outer membrane protein OmpA-like peptidoglycan-associated protein [Labrys monachus]
MTLRKRLFSVAGTLLLAVSPTALVLAQDAQAPTSAVETPAIPQPRKKADTEGRQNPKDNAPPASKQESSPPAAPAETPKAPQPPPSADHEASTPGARPAGPKAPDAAPAREPDAAAPAKPRKPQQPSAADHEASTPGAKPPAPTAGGKDGGKAESAPAAAEEAARPAAPKAPEAAPAREPDVAAPAKPRKPQQPSAGQPREDQTPSVAGRPPEGGPAAELLRDQRPASQLSDDDLRQRLLDSRRLLADPALSPSQRDMLHQRMQSIRQEFQRRQAGTADTAAPPRNRPAAEAPPASADDGRPKTPSSRAAADPAAEQRALGLLADGTPFDHMSDQALRQRLGVYRGALAAGNLSPSTERGLIQRLNAAREALRGRVAEEEDGGPLPGDGRAKAVPIRPGWDPQFGRPQFHLGSPRPQDIPAILADRRPSALLTLDQLNRRILVFRDAATDQRYSPEDRDAFGQYLQSDRNELRSRLLNDRGQRSNRIQRATSGGRLHLDVDIAPRGGPRAQSIWAAEVGDDQIEQQFAARPLQPLQRRFPRAALLADPEMVMEQPFIRRAIPSVELDTIHFGFNEAFIREEEVSHLDRIGRIIERIVAAHPDEVFVIEGNTDAVGDDAYNLALSKKRAEAVKQALTQYYVIAPRNLVTAGLGERYLKIPTEDPEQENRRVTLRRITPVLQD